MRFSRLKISCFSYFPISIDSFSRFMKTKHQIETIYELPQLWVCFEFPSEFESHQNLTVICTENNSRHMRKNDKNKSFWVNMWKLWAVCLSKSEQLIWPKSKYCDVEMWFMKIIFKYFSLRLGKLVVTYFQCILSPFEI